VFDAYANVLISKQNLNRILNRSITAQIELEPLDMDQLMIFTSKEAFELMDNTEAFEKAYQFGLQKAYQSSPEIQRLGSLIKAKHRELKIVSRQRWLPEITLNGKISENLDDSRSMPENSDGQDWQVMLNARIPIFRGGQIRAEVQQGQLELAQLENQLEELKQTIAQKLRASMNNLITSMFNLSFSSDAAKAAERSLLLVTDSYSKGAVPVVNLLDAQNASISANLAEVQASISFFRANIETQRTIGLYEFLMSNEQKQEIREILTSLFEGR
jgi:outer membrane protein TolC